MAATPVTMLPLRSAADRLGVPTDTLRKRLQRGLTPGRKVDGAWLVEVPDSPGPVPDPDPDGVQDRTDHQDGPGPVQDTPSAPLAVQRAEEMARYSRELLAPYVAKIEAQAERIGRLAAELEHARANGHPQQDAPPAESQTGRSWWRRLFG